MEIPADVLAIAAAEIAPAEGDEGVLGRGALGEVRRGVWTTAGGGETGVALKRLFMLRDDAGSVAEIGGALSPEEKAADIDPRQADGGPEQSAQVTCHSVR